MWQWKTLILTSVFLNGHRYIWDFQLLTWLPAMTFLCAGRKGRLQKAFGQHQVGQMELEKSPSHTGGWNQGTLKGPRGLEMTSIAIESEYFHICKLYVSKYMFGCTSPILAKDEDICCTKGKRKAQQLSVRIALPTNCIHTENNRS